MSLKGTIFVLPYDYNDKIFDYNNISNAKYFYIREELNKYNIQLHTQDILPEKGTIVIIPASRSHSAIYNGKSDRVMIGINFYSI